MHFLSTRKTAVAVVLGVALCGVAATALLWPGTSNACSCSPDTWKLRLVSVTSNGLASDHEAYWPKQAEYWPISNDSVVLTDDFIADAATLHHVEFRRREADGGIR
jgi:hypothetical protein